MPGLATTPCTIPILSADNLYLEDLSTVGAGERFAQIFADTWRRFPSGDKHLLQKYWRKDRPIRRRVQSKRLGGTGENNHIPRIQLISDWRSIKPDLRFVYPYDDPYDPDGEPPNGMVLLRGYLIRFYAPTVSLMPDSSVSFLIAHELYHVVLDATGAWLNFTLQGDDEEEEVNDLAQRAGFGSYAEYRKGHAFFARTGRNSFVPLFPEQFHQRTRFKRPAAELWAQSDSPIHASAEESRVRPKRPLRMSWQQYAGPRGGRGWISDYGEVRYQPSMPHPSEEGTGEGAAEGAYNWHASQNPGIAKQVAPLQAGEATAIRKRAEADAKAAGIEHPDLHRQAARYFEDELHTRAAGPKPSTAKEALSSAYSKAHATLARPKPGFLGRLLGKGKSPTVDVPTEPEKPTKQFASPMESKTVQDTLSGKAEHTLISGLAGGGHDTFLDSVMAENGKGEPPRIVDKATMDGLAKKGWRISYRGVTDAKFAEQFKTGEMFNGAGIYGNGTYVAHVGEKFGHRGAKGIAETYASKTGAISVIAIPPTAKLISTDDLDVLRSRAIAALERDKANGKINPTQHHKLREIYRDAGRFAALHNYDGIDVPHRGFTVMLNRAILAVQQENI